MPDTPHRFATRCVHAGQEPEPVTGAVSAPIFQTSTYVLEAPGQDKGYEYARLHNPTREAAEANIADLENGGHGIAFSSGLASLDCLAKTVAAGGHVVSESNVYGGTYKLFAELLPRAGIQCTVVDCQDLAAVRRAMLPETKLLHIETPTNPMLRVADVAALAAVAHENGAILCVDNTFASPVNQNPLDLGADVVMHSATKYLNGHSDVLAGVLVANDDALAEELRVMRKSTGPVPGPMDCWLVLRGAKTLHVRMQRHNENGQRVAEFLETAAGVRAVHYPGLPSHPQHELAARQMRGFSGMVSVRLDGDAAARLVQRLRLFKLATSLGGVESMISVPVVMTHDAIPEELRLRDGITDDLVRLSVGIEDARDLIADLRQALGA